MMSFPGIAPVLAIVFGLVFLAVSDDSGYRDKRADREKTSVDSKNAGGGAGNVDFSDGLSAGDERRPSVAGWTMDRSVYGGIPVARSGSSRFVTLDNQGFDTGWSESRLCPVWTGYRVGGTKRPGKLKRPGTFSRDRRTRMAVTHRDYTRSGYDRGHMAPNHAIATRYGRDAQVETFRMSNVCPQTPDLNRGIWKKIEGKVARKWSQRFEEVWVITGPVYDDDREFLHGRTSGVEIPDAFFKVIIDEVAVKTDQQNSGVSSGASHNAGSFVITPGHRPRVLAFLIPQEVSRKDSPSEFFVSVDWIEERTGLDLMPDLPDGIEARIESEIADRLW